MARVQGDLQKNGTTLFLAPDASLTVRGGLAEVVEALRSSGLPLLEFPYGTGADFLNPHRVGTIKSDWARSGQTLVMLAGGHRLAVLGEIESVVGAVREALGASSR